MTISLLPFQIAASAHIAERFHALVIDRKRPFENATWATPYYQALSALTGAGKTPILADAVAQMRTTLESEPIVLWISKAKAVVEQTHCNFSAGGKYAHFVEGFRSIYFSELNSLEVEDRTSALVVFTTVGSFNQRDKEDGSLRAHKKSEDQAKGSVWELLHDRGESDADDRRPLMIVYDEGHNLSDQQTDLLLELEPDAILVASATMKTPGKLGKLIERLRDHGWKDDQLVTTVNSKEVVAAGLVKKQIVLGGYATTMESAIDDLLVTFKTVEKKAKAHYAGFLPKSIYVCKTNISQDDGLRDNHLRPFSERRAPPILIWKHLVSKGVPPSEIAVYCDLKFDRKNFAPPCDFNLFTGGEDDFAVFQQGKFRHIIFNQSLQEGWDDPECCCAYIDKSMGSSIQVEQIIGRVLRQPNATHFPDPDLNTASFFIRIDDKQVFPEILDMVRKRIAAEVPEIKLQAYSDKRERERLKEEPKAVRTVPQIHIDLDITQLVREVATVIDYRNDTTNTVGEGERIRAVQKIGQNNRVSQKVIKTKHSNRVMARWVVRRSIQALYPEVTKSIDWSDPKFDAAIEITSPAAQTLRHAAQRLVDTYFEGSELTYEEGNPYTVGPVSVDPPRLEKFDNALHRGYSDLSPSELLFAKAIDTTGIPWARNQVSSGYSIPLLEIGSSFNFYPDFLVWKGSDVYVLDPKGEHLIDRDAGKKLLSIRDEKGKQRVRIRLFTPGNWKDTKTRTAKDGITVWSMSNAGKIKSRHFDTIFDAVNAALQ
jgi:type III restriction enzyme